MTTKRHTFHWQQIAALVLAFFAFLLSAYFSATTFERLPHLEDELAYLYQAKIFAGGQLTVDVQPPTQTRFDPFWQPFVVKYEGQRFGKYTPGWSALLSPGVLMGQWWVINAFFSALNVVLVYKLGERLFNRDTGLIAALLLTFSPIALLLNASLMGHTSALCFALLFVNAYLYIERKQSVWRWAILAGLSLGILTVTRPLTSIAIATPFIAWSGVRLLFPLIKRQFADFGRKLAPLLVLSVFALTVASFIPIFNHAATGDSGQNLYLLVWDYDRIGFGEGYGRSGHNMIRAERHTRYDLSLLAADLFGWQLEPIDDEIREHLLTRSTTYPATGYSFLLMPIGVLIAFLLYTEQRKSHARNHRWLSITVLAGWAILAYAWVYLLQNWETLGLAEAYIESRQFAFTWLGIAILGVIAPMLVWRGTNQPTKVSYTWLLLSVVLGIVIAQMFYWIGSQRYSTRYYYEAIFAAALLTAIPISYLAQRFSRLVVYSVMIVLCLVTFIRYSHPRIDVLYRYNEISPELVQQVNERRQTDDPLLVIVTNGGDERVRWRAYGELMVEINPYHTSDIVTARDYADPDLRQALIDAYPDRELMIVYGVGNDLYFEHPDLP